MRTEWRTLPFERLLSEPVRNGIYKTKEFHGRGAKIVNMGELFAHPRLRSVPMKRVELSDAEAEKFMLSEGDLIFARRSLVAEGAGKCSIVLEIDEPTAFESSIIRARPDISKADSLFLYYFFNSAAGLHSLETIRRQVAVAGITGTDLSQLEVPVPSLAVQRAMAHILGSLDDKIELNRQMNETLEAIARAIFKSWFVDFDPVRAKMEGRQPSGMSAETASLFPDSLADSELGLIPDGWTMSRVADEFDVLMGQSPSGSSYNQRQEGVPLYQGKGEFGFRFPTKRLFCTEPKRMASRGDTLVSVRAPVGAMNMAREECCVGRGLASVRHKSGSRSYTYYALDSMRASFEMFEAEGTVFGSITKSAFASISCLRPPDSLVRAFEDLAGSIDSTIELNEDENRTLVQLRDALLPKLISGELRLEAAEDYAAEALS